MKKQFTILFILILFLFVFANNASAAAPIISSINISSFWKEDSSDVIYSGDTITIFGENFRPYNSSKSELIINGEKSYAFFSGGYWKDDQIIFTAPSSSGYVQVINNNGEISNKFEFTVFQNPNNLPAVIDFISIDNVYPEAEVIIRGTGFNNKYCIYSCGKVMVNEEDSFYDKNATIINWSATEIKFTMPDVTSNGYFQIATVYGVYSNKYNYTLLFCSEISWTCSDWGPCSLNGTQTRTCNKASNCEGGVSAPATTQSCLYTPTCTINDWSCGGWSSCSSSGSQSRSCSKISNCEGDVTSLVTTQSCIYYPPSINSGDIDRCDQITKNIKYWMDLDLSTINPDGLPYSPAQISSMQEARHGAVIAQVKNLLDLFKQYQCSSGTQCTQDTWQCGNWGTCSLQGIQIRSCNRTYDCPSAETASPSTSQYCQAPVQPQQYQEPNQQVNISQASILKATVKLICPLDSRRASQGSGTIINSDGTILTNKHVVDGTLGCLVGFIDGANDQPYFSDRHIADITKVSSSSDIAILKLRNPNRSTLTAINITTGNSNVVSLGNKITTYGYPADFGEKITYTSGDFSGYNGDYLKTTAILEHGNSGGGAYLPNGTFIGIPSAVISGSLNSMGLVLSINKINSWMNNTSLARDNSNNSYARVSSLLEDIDLNTLHLFEFTESDNQTDSVVIESNETLDRERSSMTKIDRQLSSRLKGKILLQVESVGEAWYVSPDDSRKYYMKDGDTAYEMLRQFGLGITDADIAKIPVGIESRFEDTDSDGDGLADQLEEGLKTDPYKSDTDSDGVSDGDEILVNNTNPLGSGVLTYNSSLNSRLRGKILLQVESLGEAWYLNPDDGKRYYMKHGGAAYQIMRYLSLGITNDDLRKIDIGEIN